MTEQQGTAGAPQEKSGGGLIKLIIAVAIIAVGIIVAWKLGVFENLKLNAENIQNMEAWFAGLGWIGPAVFILIWIVACVFFLPGLPVTIVGGLVFGALFGTIYSIIGSTLGATAAFLVGRYAARDMVGGLMQKNPTLKKIDQGVEREGWRMLMVTRFVPVFPFNAQNYVYGLTKINVGTYALVSFVCMLPACAMFNMFAGTIRDAVLAGENWQSQMGPMIWKLAIMGLLLVALSFIPKLIQKKMGSKDLIEGEK